MRIIDYIYSNNNTFAENELTPVDAIVFCQLSYARLEAQAPSYTPIQALHKAEYFSAFFCDKIADEINRAAFSAACASRRYRDIKVVKTFTKDNDDEQLAAVIFEIDENTDFVAFRGTDGTLVGWKENCEMAIRDYIPSQADAVKFINEEYRDSTRKLYIGGHSKGGNLAIATSVFCDEAIRDRIIGTYSFDGPGFNEKARKAIDETKGVNIMRYVPQDSIIGMLLDNPAGYTVVKSDADGLGQHDISTWEVEDEHFVVLEKTSHVSTYVDNTVSNWLNNASQSEKEAFVTNLFGILFENGFETVGDLQNMNYKDTLRLLESMYGLDKETRKILGNFLKSLAKSAVRHLV